MRAACLRRAGECKSHSMRLINSVVSLIAVVLIAWPANAQEMSDFITKMKNGEVQVLFVHGVNPVFEIPKAMGSNLANVLINNSSVFSSLAISSYSASKYRA